MGGVSISCMLDTRSECGVSNNCLTKYPRLKEKCQDIKEVMYIADGEKSTLKSKVMGVTLTLGEDTKIECDLYVINSPWYDLLIGKNTIKVVNRYSTNDGFYFLSDHYQPFMKVKSSNMLVCNTLEKHQQGRADNKETNKTPTLTSLFPSFPLKGD